MLQWLRQVNANRKKSEFRAYYDQELTPTQHEVCNTLTTSFTFFNFHISRIRVHPALRPLS